MLVTVHVRDVKLEALRKVLPSCLSGGGGVRIVPDGRWISVAVEDLDDGEPLAEALSKALRATAISVWYWNGESRTAVALFERGERIGELALPEAARSVGRSRVAVPLGVLSRLVGDGERKDGLEVRAAIENDDASYMSLEDTAHPLKKAFGLSALVYDAYDLEDDEDSEPLSAEPVDPGPTEAEVRARLEAYEGRVFAVGSVVLEATAKSLGPLLSATAAPLAKAFAPHLGAVPFEGIRVAIEGYRSVPFEPPTTARDWTRAAAALRDQTMIELRSKGALVASIVTVFHDDALAVSWCFRALKDAAKRERVTDAMRDVIVGAAERKECFGALLTAQRGAIALENRATAYEYLRGRSGAALRPTWQREHPRGPGWLVLVPKACAATPKWPGTKTPAGRLLHSEAADPYAMTTDEMTAMETALEPSLGRYA